MKTKTTTTAALTEFALDRVLMAVRSQVLSTMNLTHDQLQTGYSKENVLVTNWIMSPQAVLRRTPVVAFITHGDVESIVECIYASKPLIVFPLTADGNANAARVVDKVYYCIK